MSENRTELMMYQTEDGQTKIDVRMENETVWLSLDQMAELFQRDKSTISRHIRNIFAEGELDREAVVAKFATTASDGKTYQVDFYNLDVIISVGYRVRSLRGTQFRIWANSVLKEYLIKGFAMNDDRLKDTGGKDYFDELLERVRDIRSSEKVFWRKVLDIYATSADYSANARESTLFFQTVQNKMLYRQVTTEDNVGYNIIPFGYITFRSRSDDGRFKFNQNSIIDRGIISYFYPVFTFSDGVSCEFLLQLLNHTIYKKMFPYAEGTAQQVLSLKKLGRFKYPVPQIHEQQKIATVLSSQDKLVELKEKLLAEKQRQKKYLMQQLLTGKKRLSDFTVPWVATSLGNLFSERKETNCEKLQLLAITGTQGVIPRSELDLKDNSSEDKSKYLKIRIGDIGYNTMRMWQGVSAYSDYEGIVSPAYTILKPVADIDAKYFSYLFKLPETVFLFYRFSQGLVDDTRNLKYENFKKITVRYPSDRREQTAIAKVLSTADREIDLLRQDIDQEKQKKKALMQLLLTGIVRVTPCH